MATALTIPVNVSCELTPDSGEPWDVESVRQELSRELALIGEDLALDVGSHVDVRLSGEKRKTGDGSTVALYVDGKQFHSAASATRDTPTLVRLVHGLRAELITESVADHLWGSWGGAGVAPAAFATLLRELARQRIRVARIAPAVLTWDEHDVETLFEEALGGASRKVFVHLHPSRTTEVESAFRQVEDSPILMMVDGLFYELGILVGQCETIADETVPPDSLRVRINDLRTCKLPMLLPDECLVNDTVDRLRLLNIEGRQAVNPANGNECAIIPLAESENATDAGLTTWDPAGYVILATSAEIRNSAPALLSLEVMRSQLDKLGTAFPYLITHVQNGIGPLRFTHIARLLLEEGIGIRNMRDIIDSLATVSPPQGDSLDFSRYIVFTSSFTGMLLDVIRHRRMSHPGAVDTTEAIRHHLKRYISHKFTRGHSTLVVYLLDPALEERLHSRRPLSRAESRWFLKAVWNEVASLPTTAQIPCILTSAEIRRRVRYEIEHAFPHVAVLSYQELSPDMNIQPIARISADDPPEEGPEDAVDRALAELQFEEAQRLVAGMVDTVWPTDLLEPRLAELLYFWNEAGQHERIAENLSIWLSSGLLDARAKEAVAALREQPDRDAARRWLEARNRTRFRRLKQLYYSAPEDLVVVGGGRFTMGDAQNSGGDRPVREVELDDFQLARVPVTGRQFALYLQANGKPVPQQWVAAEDAARGISWREAIEYCEWLSRVHEIEPVYGQFPVADHTRNGFRLPTEAEWEYAARGGSRTHGFRFAGSDRLVDVGDVTGEEPVCLRNANGLGLYEMSGGRAEWCWDWYGAEYYTTTETRNPMGPPAGSSRVTRGGDPTGMGDVSSCMVYARGGDAQALERYRSMNLGFRIARSRY